MSAGTQSEKPAQIVSSFEPGLPFGARFLPFTPHFQINKFIDRGKIENRWILVARLYQSTRTFRKQRDADPDRRTV